MNKKFWSAAEDARLLALLATGKTHQDIAAELGRPRSSIGSRLDRMGMRGGRYRGGRRQPPLAARGWRPCLCCDKNFLSEGPGHRLCGVCRHKSVSPYAP